MQKLTELPFIFQNLSTKQILIFIVRRIVENEEVNRSEHRYIILFSDILK